MAPDSALLQSIPLFATMDGEERAALIAAMDEVTFAPGEVIYVEDESGGVFYVIVSGAVEVALTDDDGGRVVLDVLESGAFFGELSLLDGGPRSATATALAPTTALALDRADLLPILRERPHMVEDVMSVLVKRVRHTDDLLRRRASRDPNAAIAERETLGDRVADTVARFGGSWTFIFIFGAVLLVWVAVNSVLLGRRAFDPYPFILLNLFLSMIAAIQAPVIMMSQNRQDARDRIRSELDYQVNRKAELEIAQLIHHVKALREQVGTQHAGRR